MTDKGNVLCTDAVLQNIDGVYWTAAWTAHAVAKLLVKQRVEGASITFVSSFLGYAAVPGYTPYTPGKFAVRGLADSLRAELKLYDIAVHLYMPAGILSPGYEDEQKIKHALTKKIEESDTPISAELCTKYLLKGIERGQYQITNDLLTDIVRVSTCGPVPWNGPMDVVYGFFGLFAMPIYRFVVESTTKKFKKSIEEEHKADGFYDN